MTCPQFLDSSFCLLHGSAAPTQAFRCRCFTLGSRTSAGFLFMLCLFLILEFCPCAVFLASFCSLSVSSFCLVGPVENSHPKAFSSLLLFREARGLSVLPLNGPHFLFLFLPWSSADGGHAGHARDQLPAPGLRVDGLCWGRTPRSPRACPDSGSSLDRSLVVCSGRLCSFPRRLCEQLLGNVSVSQRVLCQLLLGVLGVRPNCSTVPFPKGTWGPHPRHILGQHLLLLGLSPDCPAESRGGETEACLQAARMCHDCQRGRVPGTREPALLFPDCAQLRRGWAEGH